jgi:hypothetical protein
MSAAPEPAENSAGAALVPAPWEISARAALRTKPQGAAARNHNLRWPIAPATGSFYASDGWRTVRTELAYTIARTTAVIAVTTQPKKC